MNLCGRAIAEKFGRLFAHDFSILATTIRATFAWRDRVAAIIVLALLIAALRALISGHPENIVQAGALGIGMMIGVMVERVVLSRLSFHATDGMLGGDALEPRLCRRYAALCHGIGIVGLTILVAMIGVWLILPVLIGYLCGSAFGHGLAGLKVQGFPVRHWIRRWRRTARAWTRRGVAGIAGAVLVTVLLLPFAGMEGLASLFAAVSVAAVVALAITSVDHGTVRFMAMSGYGVWAALRVHLLPGAWFLVFAVLLGAIIHGPAIGTAIAGITIAALSLQALRVLAYHLHSKQFGDWLVALLIGIVALVALSLPFLVPVLLAIVFWHLHRRASASTWSIE